MNNKYEINIWKDNEYAVYDLQDINSSTLKPVFIGTIEEVNAWISLKEKGFNI